MTKFSNAKRLTQKQQSELIKLKKEFDELGLVDPFSVYDSETRKIHFFEDFCEYVEGKAQCYQKLWLLAKRLRSESSNSGKSLVARLVEHLEPGSRKNLQSVLYGNELLKRTYQQVKTKVNEIFSLVKGYIYKLQSDKSLSDHLRVLLPSTQSLTSLLDLSSEKASAKVRVIDEELNKATEILEKWLQDELQEASNSTQKIKNIQNNQNSKELPFSIQEGSQDKASMTELRYRIGKIKKPARERAVVSSVDLRRIDVKRYPNQSASSLINDSEGQEVLFHFLNKLALIHPTNGYGKLVDYIKDDRPWFNRGNSRGITAVVKCREFYYLLKPWHCSIHWDPHNTGQPVQWWVGQKASFWRYLNGAKRTKDHSAIIANMNDSKLVVIEVKKNGQPGRELEIVTNGQRLIDCFEILPGNKIITIDRRGVVILYKVDFFNFKNYVESGSYQIPEHHHQNNIGRSCLTHLSVCQRGELCVVAFEPSKRSDNLAFERPERPPETVRLVLFKLDHGHDPKSPIRLMTQVDLPGRRLVDLGGIRFSQYIQDAVVLCEYSIRHGVEALGYDCSKNKLVYIKSEATSFYSKCYQLTSIGSEVWGMIEGGEIFRLKFYLSL